ncbi:hypothetical protein HXY33_00190 [Candidatus Bathyarchaeota archaeon]|nr:hypothetical protein [Candidatus Bathyarchaeota archaeon]
MLGVYEHFPINIHKITIFSASVPSKKLQQMLTKTLSKMNKENFSSEDIAIQSLSQCTVIFESGIAEANNFNYLDEEETNKALKAIQKKPLQIMDFFCALRYYKIQNEKKTSLKFDYYMMRFIFNKDLMEMQVFHEKGPRYVSPEDITRFIADRINKASSKKMLKAPEKP